MCDEAQATNPSDSATESLFGVRPPDRRPVLFLLAVAFALRLVLIVGLRTYDVPTRSHNFQFGAEYGRTARSLVLGRGFTDAYDLDSTSPSIRGLPLFPLYLAALFRIFGVYSTAAAFAVMVGNSAAMLVAAYLTFLLARRLFGRAVAWVALVWMCFGPTPLWYSVNCTWDTAFSSVAAMLPPLMLLWLERRPTWRRGAIVGLVAGVSAHLHVGVIVVYALLGLWTVVRLSGCRKAAMQALGAAALVGAVCITPWSVRQSLVAGQLVIMRTDGSTVLVLGNCPGATGDSRDRKNLLIYNPTERKLYYEMGEVEYFRYCRTRAMNFIRSNPGAYLRLTLKRAVVFWLGDFWRPTEWKGSLRINVPLERIKQMLFLAPTLIAAAGLILACRRGYTLWPLLCQIVAYSMPYILVYVGMTRYRVPIHGSLVVLGSVALCHAWRWLPRLTTRRAKPHEPPLGDAPRTTRSRPSPHAQ